MVTKIRIEKIGKIFLLISWFVFCYDGITFLQADTLYFKEEKSVNKLKGLPGKLKEIKEKVLYWEHPKMGEMEIDLRSVGALVLERKGEKRRRQGQTLLLTNGDVVVGTLISLDAETIVLKSSCGEEEISVPRALGDRLNKNNRKSLLEEKTHWVINEPESLLLHLRESKGWKHGTEGDGALLFQGGLPERKWKEGPPIPTGSVSQKGTLPVGNFLLSFDYHSSKPVALKIEFGKPLLDRSSLSSKNTLHLSPKMGWYGGSGLDEVDKENFEELKKENVQFEIYYDAEEKTMEVYANRKKINTYRDIFVEREELVFQGKNGHPCILSNIRIYSWGKEGRNQVGELDKEKEEDQIGLTNGSVLMGKIESIHGGKLKMQTNFGENIETEAERVERIYFGKKGKQWKERADSDQLILQDGTKLSVQVESVDGEYIKCRGVYGDKGERVFQRETLKQLIFQGEQPYQKDGRIYLKNGEELIGEIKEMDGAQMIIGGGPFLKKIIIEGNAVNKVEMPHGGVVPENALTYFRLRNGDLLHGRVGRWDEKRVVLKTAYAGDIEIPRHAVETIWFTKEASPLTLYEGPFEEREWETYQIDLQKEYHFSKQRAEGIIGQRPMSKRGWAYGNRAFQVGTNSWGVLMKQIDTPDKVAIEFTLDWKEKMLLTVSLFADNAREILKANRYELEFHNFGVYFVRCTFDEKKEFPAWAPHIASATKLGSVKVPELTKTTKEKKSVRIKLFIDKKKGEFIFFVNDRITQRWRENSIENIKGIAFHPFDTRAGFNTVGVFGEIPKTDLMQVRNIKITYWDGVLAGEKDEVEELGGDVVLLKNRDTINGKIQDLQEERVLIQTKTLPDPLSIDRSKIIKIALRKQDPNNAPKKITGNASVLLKSGGRLTVQLEGIEKGKLKGVNANFENKEIELTAVKEILFHTQDTFITY